MNSSDLRKPVERIAEISAYIEGERVLLCRYTHSERGESLMFGIWEKPSGSYAGEIALKEFVPEIPSADTFLTRDSREED